MDQDIHFIFDDKPNIGWPGYRSEDKKQIDLSKENGYWQLVTEPVAEYKIIFNEYLRECVS